MNDFGHFTPPLWGTALELSHSPSSIECLTVRAQETNTMPIWSFNLLQTKATLKSKFLGLNCQLLTMNQAPYRILFVCMGNICRSPTAHGVLEYHSRKMGWQNFLLVDSAGTHNHHPGSAPDLRTQRHARQRGYDLSGLRARRIGSDNFECFDLILPMDEENLSLTRSLSPKEHHVKIKPFSLFFRNHQETSVPDPYYGGQAGFELVLDLIEDGVHGLVAHLSQGVMKEHMIKNDQ